jgi:hypothetical protein
LLWKKSPGTEGAKKELANDVRPEFAAKVENMQDYDVISLELCVVKNLLPEVLL